VGREHIRDVFVVVVSGRELLHAPQVFTMFAFLENLNDRNTSGSLSRPTKQIHVRLGQTPVVQMKSVIQMKSAIWSKPVSPKPVIRASL